MTDMISFVDPAKIGAINCGTPVARSRAISLRFKNAKPAQIFLCHITTCKCIFLSTFYHVCYLVWILLMFIVFEQSTTFVINRIVLFFDMFKSKSYLVLLSRNHWALTVVNPEAQMVYHMDPLKRRIANEEWTEVVNKLVRRSVHVNS